MLRANTDHAASAWCSSHILSGPRTSEPSGPGESLQGVHHLQSGVRRVSPHMLKTTWTRAPHRMPVLSPECTHTAAARPRGSEALTEIQAPSTGQPGHAPQTAHQSGRCPTGQLSNHAWWTEVAVPRGASRALAAPQVNSVQLILWKLERATRSKVRNFT